ncbi:biliverdin-producing heme oxygenase [Polaribacter sp. WD7]|uniref:biliverdin-producing heme oxygenase n=1 Tax=Polaribacter sp. WD7 TaxID=2269061 RepID=UPI0015F0987C|nr:biliverdin-producing heme oxygenase [Polaribacter sp. WD7]
MKQLLDKEILKVLKEETKLLHDIVDKSSGADKIISHTISVQEFTKLLEKNYLAYSHIEANICCFKQENLVKQVYFLPRISNWVLKDLKKISFSLLTKNTSIFLNNKFEALGAIYVTEGSLLGGLVLGKHLTECNQLSNTTTLEFYKFDKDRLMRWEKFRKHMTQSQFSAEERNQIVQGAKKTFKAFIKYFK